MLRLALLAMLLLALLPTLGRLVPHGVQAAQTGWAAICTATGLKYVDLSLHDATRGHDLAAPEHPGGHGGPDCAYCPLLLSLLAASFWLALLRAAQIVQPAFNPHLPPRRRVLHPCGLGSRGPPSPVHGLCA